MIHTHTLSHNWKSSEFLVDMYLAEIGLYNDTWTINQGYQRLDFFQMWLYLTIPRREFFSVTSASRTASQALGGTVNVNFKRCVGYWPVWVLQDMPWLLPWLWMNRCNVTSIFHLITLCLCHRLIYKKKIYTYIYTCSWFIWYSYVYICLGTHDCMYTYSVYIHTYDVL